MDIDNPMLTTVTDQVFRPLADKLFALFPIPSSVIAITVGKGLSKLLGTTDEKLLQSDEWTQADYDAIPIQNIVGTDRDNRLLLNNHQIIKIIRGTVALQNLYKNHSDFGATVAGVSVNQFNAR